MLVVTSYAAPTLSAPSNNPYWDNVGQMSGASAVYLGGGWAITANHVTENDLRLSDGRDFAVAPGSEVVLSNPLTSGATGNADLRMFRLTQDPGLPSLPIISTTPASNSLVMMIGAGRDWNSTEIGWQTSTVPWRQEPMPVASVRGFELLSTSHMRWGINHVSGNTTVSNGTVVFTTTYTQNGGPFLAQAVTGDSGGGVFEQVNGGWQLVGIMDAITLLSNQPSDTIVFGDSTNSANLATYHDEILKVMQRTCAGCA